PLTNPQPHWTVTLARNGNVEVIGDIELFCRERAKSGRRCPLIAITGTNGKSTTTALIAHLLNSAGRDAQMGGNIGVPVLALQLFGPDHAYVLEVSSYQIDLAPSLRPTVGVLLNVTEDHIDRHGTIENYAAIKERLPANVETGGTAVIDIDDGFTLAAADQIQRVGKNVVRVSVVTSLADGYYAEGSRILRAKGGNAVVVADLQGSDRCAGCTMPKTRLVQSRLAQRSALMPPRFKKVSKDSPALPTGWNRSDARARFCSSTIRRRPMPTQRPKHWRALRTFSGSR